MRPDFYKATNKARELLNSNPAYKESRPVNFSAILKDLELSAKISGDIKDEALLDPIQRTIYILNDNKPTSRKFFSIAHEIGHWMLHSKDKSRSRTSDYSLLDPQGIIEEQEANAFAAELLMPYDEVMKCIIFGYGVQELSQYFNVSYEFALNRYNFVSAMEFFQ